ncbi:MAG: NAD(P)H-dependent oxidoreductase [Candidatus Bathyarchaeota archaeon]|nr:NAD(P)H-dependent oxidoreductase [Candidatus Bathyarchaeota archaeon]
MDKPLRVLAFAGSLRHGSFNKALVRAALEVKPENVEIEVFDLEGISLYNQDLEIQPPSRVIEFKTKIRQADALLIATPEYNYSIPGVLKNALDWASRPKTGNPLDGKPIAIMSASTGRLGGARSQYHLRQTFVFLDMHPVNRPEVMLSNAKDHVDLEGNLTNEDTKRLIRQLLEELAKWTVKLKNPP